MKRYFFQAWIFPGPQLTFISDPTDRACPVKIPQTKASSTHRV